MSDLVAPWKIINRPDGHTTDHDSLMDGIIAAAESELAPTGGYQKHLVRGLDVFSLDSVPGDMKRCPTCVHTITVRLMDGRDLTSR